VGGTAGRDAPSSKEGPAGGGLKQSAGGPDGSQPANQRPDELDDGVVLESEDDADFNSFHDDEEFENVDGSDSHRSAGGRGSMGSSGGASSSGDKDDEGAPTLKITDVPAHLRNNWFNFQVELIMIFGLGIYLVNYVYGKTKNQALATAWFEGNRRVLEENFAIVGDDGRDKEPPSEGVMLKESDSVFSVWCSGRAACQSMLAQLRLLKRQDLVSMISKLVKPSYDQLVIKAVMNADDMDTFVFVVGKTKTLTKLGKEMTDLSSYCANKKAGESNGLPASMMVLSELGEASAAMLDPKIVATLNRYEECIDYIHISDQYTGPRPQDYETDSQKLPEAQRVLIFGFNIPGKTLCSEKHVESIKPLLSFVFYCIDKTKRFRLSREAKVKADKNRLRVEESFLKTTHAARQEAAQARKEEKIRERKERMMNEDDPDKQRRLEKQELKREAKRKLPKMKQLKIKAM
jgi:hypothetical protein